MARWSNRPHHIGRPCKKCGSREKYFKGGCVLCTRIRTKNQIECRRAMEGMERYRSKGRYYRKTEAAPKPQRLYPKLGFGITLDMLTGRR